MQLDDEASASLKSARPAAARLKYAAVHPSSSKEAVRVTEEGATFRSYRDGSMLTLTPETTVHAQKALGADIIIPLDDLPSAATAKDALDASVARTHRWEARSLRAHLADVRQQAMYGVVHGGLDERLRSQSLEYIAGLPFDGFAIGGSLGRDRNDMHTLLRFLAPQLPRHKPCHLLGIGDVDSIIAAVQLGIDTFDSCWPTRMGRHGTALTWEGPLRIGQARFREDYRPLDEALDGTNDAGSCMLSRAYLHHLWRAKEPVVHGLLTLHNIRFMMALMADVRARIKRDEL